MWHRFMVKTHGKFLEIYFLFLAYVLVTTHEKPMTEVSSMIGQLEGKRLSFVKLYIDIYHLYLLILAINITVKFTKHLEHTRKASSFIPALVL